MPSVKEELKQIAEQLPDDCTWDEVLYRLYVRERIQKGLDSLNQGKSISHEQAMKEIRPWAAAS